MAHWNDFDDYNEPENRPAAVKRHLARSGLSLDPTDARTLPGDTTSPDDIERRQRKAMEALQRHDAFWGIYRGCALGGLPPGVSVGDPEGRDD